jgi:predicted methyltransferase
MALANRSLGFAFLTVGVLVLAACERQPAAPPPGQAAPPTPAAVAPTPAPAAESIAAAAIAAAVANPARPAEDVARDADRKPAETLAFFDVKPGEVVFEFVAGGGYFTELLSRTVGDTGRVVATREDPKRIADGRLPNVTSVPDTQWGLAPDSVDLIFTALNYHDVVNLKVERPPLLKNFMTILKPGGLFAVIDHSAEAGSGTRDVGTLHRIDEATVVSEVKAAGFELVGSSNLLRNPNDARTLAVFDPAIRGKTDVFVLKFRKPTAAP